MNNWQAYFPKESEQVHERVLRTLEGVEELGRTRGSRNSGKILLLVAILAAAIGTTVIAAELYKWNQITVKRFENPTQQLQDKLVMEGVMASQEGETNVNGITVTPVETMQDVRKIYILLKVSGEKAVLSGGYFDSWHLLDEEGNRISFGSDVSYSHCHYKEAEDEYYLALTASWESDCEVIMDKVTLCLRNYKYFEHTKAALEGEWLLPLTINNSQVQELRGVYESEEMLVLRNEPWRLSQVILTPFTCEMIFEEIQEEALRRELLEPYEAAADEDLSWETISRKQKTVLQFVGIEYEDGTIIENVAYQSESGNIKKYGSGDWQELSDGTYCYDVELSCVADTNKVAAILIGERVMEENGEERIVRVEVKRKTDTE